MKSTIHLSTFLFFSSIFFSLAGAAGDGAAAAKLVPHSIEMLHALHSYQMEWRLA